MLWFLLGAVVFFAVATLVISYICYRMAFYAPPRKPVGDQIELPEGEIYVPFYPSMEKWARQVRAMPCEPMQITSHDGLTLTGRYYEFSPDAPIELMFHGYRGSAERDLCGGVQRCFKLGHSALIVDQRCSGSSQGHVITFGILEHRDCLRWIDLMLERFGPQVKIILTGISMGASTVLLAAGQPLPPNVLGVLADCGFDSPKSIIKKVIRQMGLPEGLAYPFVKLGARLFGHFDLEEVTPLDAMSRCTVPVIFFHGESDDYVPCDMSRRMYEACISRKQLVTMEQAGHGLCYPVEPQRYLQALRDFYGTDA